MALDRIISAFCLLNIILFAYAEAAFTQSNLPDHPTPITRSEISGTIKARDLGDSRLTTHYYWFEGSQGDVFINLNSKNFAGDVDVFVHNGLRSLTKIVVYPDFGEVETGRVIYLRKPEKLLLRVQGRSPNDEPATYRLKFAGSFVAAVTDGDDVPAMPTVGDVAGSVRVNSVGTILPVPPKPLETRPESGGQKAAASPVETIDLNAEKSEAAKIDDKPTEKQGDSKLEVIVSGEAKVDEPPKTIPEVKRPGRKMRIKRPTPAKNSAKSVEPKTPRENNTKTKSEPVAGTEKEKVATILDPLANVQLVILFKDGSRIERRLPEISRFSVDRGVLTVISKDGRVGKYQMLAVAKVTIE